MSPIITVTKVTNFIDHAKLPWQPFSYANWEADFPYHPEAYFKISHNESTLFISYRTKESHVRAMNYDQEAVYEDSACEFFLAPAGDDAYYNFEANCVGALRVNFRNSTQKFAAPESLFSSVYRDGTFTNIDGTFDNQPVADLLLGLFGPEDPWGGFWELNLELPISALFKHDGSEPDFAQVRKWSDLAQATGALFKCGDKLPQPYFLSTNKITAPAPGFHYPLAFNKLVFEK